MEKSEGGMAAYPFRCFNVPTLNSLALRKQDTFRKVITLFSHIRLCSLESQRVIEDYGTIPGKDICRSGVSSVKWESH